MLVSGDISVQYLHTNFKYTLHISADNAMPLYFDTVDDVIEDLSSNPHREDRLDVISSSSAGLRIFKLV